MGSKNFLSTLKPLNAQRLQKSVKATVQNSGRLTFAMDAVKDMKLSEDRSIIILAAEDGNLGAVISDKGDPEAFALKKCGAYFYVTFKNYLQQAGVDYKKQRVVYDITELDETYKGKTLYKFERRFIPKGCNEDEEIEKDVPAEEQAESPAEQEAAAKPSDAAKGEETKTKAEDAPAAATKPQDETAAAPEKDVEDQMSAAGNNQGETM